MRAKKNRIKVAQFWQDFEVYRARIVERFESLVKKTDECWEWTSHKAWDGYAIFTFRGSHIKASRLSAFLHLKGFDPTDRKVFVCHKCDNRGCVNPEHLFLGSHRENINDGVNKNRFKKGEASHMSKLSIEDIQYIREKYIPKDKQFGARGLSRRFGVAHATISCVLSRKTWKQLGVIKTEPAREGVGEYSVSGPFDSPPVCEPVSQALLPSFKEFDEVTSIAISKKLSTNSNGSPILSLR